MTRVAWPSLVAAAIGDLIDIQRLNLTADQARVALLRRPSGGDRGIFEYYGRAADPDFAAAADAADQIECDFRALVRAGKIAIRGVNAATGAPTILQPGAAAIAALDFSANEVALSGGGALRLVAVQVTTEAPPPDFAPDPIATPEPGRPAPRGPIHEAIEEAYGAAAAVGEKPPNVREIVAPVQAILRKAGYYASGIHIQQLASDVRHSGRRRKPGRTVASEER